MRFLQNPKGKGANDLNWGAFEEMNLYWSPRWYHVVPPFPFFHLPPLGDSRKLGSDMSSNLPVILCMSLFLQGGTPQSPLICLSKAIYILSSTSSWRKTLPFPGFTRNWIPLGLFIMSFYSSVIDGGCGGKRSPCRAFKSLFSLACLLFILTL